MSLRAPSDAGGTRDAADSGSHALEGGPDAAAPIDAGVEQMDAAMGSHDAGGRDAAMSDSSASGLDAAAISSMDASADASTSPIEAGVDAGTDGSVATRCGNSVVEAGEECDDGAGSASCDADCTFASCGDGFLNALAGEQCDSRDLLSTCSAACRTPQCRSGCTCELYRGVRYMFCAEQLARDPSRQACEALGMQLVRIHSGTEQTFLRLRTQQSGFSKFQLGATDSAVEGTWVWDDGTAFWSGVANGMPLNGEFAAWASGEPNAYVVGENCSEVQSLQGWNDCVCDMAKPFVCLETRARRVKCGDGVVDPGEACDGGGQAATCDSDCSPVACGDGVVNAAAGEVCDDGAANQFCSADCRAFTCPAACSCVVAASKSVALCSTASTFRDAAVACGRAGMTLARLESSGVDQALRNAANSAGIGEYWIGLFDIDRPNHWLRSDLSPAWDGTASGTTHGYTNFTSGAPSGTTNQDCAAVLTNGSWQDRDCNVQKPYICERL